MNIKDVPVEMLEEATSMTDKVSFLTREEKELYAGGLVSAMLWAKSVENKKEEKEWERSVLWNLTD